MIYDNYVYVSAFAVILFSICCRAGPPKKVTCCGNQGVSLHGGVYMCVAKYWRESMHFALEHFHLFTCLAVIATKMEEPQPAVFLH